MDLNRLIELLNANQTLVMIAWVPPMIGCMTTMFAAFGVIQLVKANRAKSWPITYGTVLASQLLESRGNEGGTVYQPQIIYQYELNGQTFTNDLLYFGAKTEWSGGFLNSGPMKKVQEYPAGRQVEVRYNPNKPQESVLELRATAAMWWLGAAAMTCFIGTGAIAMVILLPGG